MNATKRAPYVALAAASGHYDILCNFCRFMEASGGSPCSEDGEYDCTHSLEAVRVGIFEWASGDVRDCWGFRPCYDVSLAADIAGILLRNEFPSHWLYGSLPTPEQVREHERLVALGRLTSWHFGDKTRRWTKGDDLDLLFWIQERWSRWVCA